MNNTSKRSYPENYVNGDTLTMNAILEKQKNRCPSKRVLMNYHTNIRQYIKTREHVFSSSPLVTVYVMVNIENYQLFTYLWDTILNNNYNTINASLFHDALTPQSIYNPSTNGIAYHQCIQLQPTPSYCIRLLPKYGIQFKLIPSVQISTSMLQKIERLLIIGGEFGDSNTRILHQIENYRNQFNSNLKIGIITFSNENCDNNITISNWPNILHTSLDNKIKLLAFPYGDCRIYELKQKYKDLHLIYWPLGPDQAQGFPSLLNPNESPLYKNRKFLLNLQVTYTVRKPTRMQAWIVATKYCNNLPQQYRYLECYNYDNILLSKIAQSIDRNIGTSFSQIKLLKNAANATYVTLLHNSRFTLCPSGNNPETRRIYEALMAGSIPIIEDPSEYIENLPVHPYANLTMRCQSYDIHYILKQMKAPVLYVKQWKDLPALLNTISEKQAIDIQQKLINWYNNKFIPTLREQLIDGFLNL